MIAAPFLTSRLARTPAKLRLAASPVASVYASASTHTHFCVVPNANAYCFSGPCNTICSEGDRC